MKKLFGSFLLLVVTALPAAAMDFPKTRESYYAPYRDELFAEGWKPLEANPAAAAKFKPFGLIEVDCGSGVAGCYAVWLSPEESREVIFLRIDEEGSHERLILSRDDDENLIFRSDPE